MEKMPQSGDNKLNAAGQHAIEAHLNLSKEIEHLDTQIKAAQEEQDSVEKEEKLIALYGERRLKTERLESMKPPTSH